MPGAVTEGVPWTGARLPRIAAAAAALWALLYLWPLADGSSAESFSTADHLLRVASTAAASGAALLAALRSPAGRRWAWGCLALGANIWAATQAVRWGYELGRPGSAPDGLSELGYAAFALGAVLAVGRLVAERGPSVSGRRALDAALLVVPVLLVSWSLGMSAVLHDDVTLDGGGHGLIQLGTRLLLDGALVAATFGLLSQRSARSPSVLVLSAGLVAVAVVDTTLISLDARGVTLPDRVVGVVLCAALTVVALGVVADALSPVAARAPTGDERSSALPPVLAAVSALVVLVTVDAGEALDWLEVTFLVVLGALALARQHLVAREADQRLRLAADREAEMRQLAFHDELTGLANRALFHDRLQHALALHRRYRRALVVLFCDLDDFKAINDAYGHLTGDAVLREVAARLAATLRPADTFARLGGDEFAVLLEDDSDAAGVVRRMKSALDAPFTVEGRTARVGMTIGIARVDPVDATPEADVLLGKADAEMYAAKRSSTRRGIVPSQPPAGAAETLPDTESHPVEAMLNTFGRDVRAGDIDVVYQPLVDTATGAVRGLEALARWSYRGTPVLPDTFIPLAVRGGLIAALTDLVLDRACAQVRAWSRALGHDQLTVSVNIAPEQLLDEAFPDRVRETLVRHGVVRDQLVLEITAAALVEDPTTAYRICRLLREAGVLLSLSELGGGPVTLAHLHRLPLDSIKVEGEGPDVVVDIGSEERVVRAFHSLARELDLRMVVEGVERAEQLAVLRGIGGMLVQGYLLARPAPAAQLDDLVLHGLSWPD